MLDARDSHREDAAALDATIQRNAEIVRRGRRERGFLKVLGLSLPVSMDDVKQAFRVKARQTHPDHNGSAAAFREVQQAFDEAVEYAKKHEKRLPWLGAQLPMYVAQRAVVDLVEKWGGSVDLERLDWLEDTVGEDFSQLADRLREVNLTDCPIGDAELSELLAEADGIVYLESLLLAGTKVTDHGVLLVTRAPSLRYLDLRRTPVSQPVRNELAKFRRFDAVEGASGWALWLRRLWG
ncbi:Chaperone protein DnaJ [Posidoniimonas polymericola]|uniref:Chaperone protein DnaJ n=1 Tax=Posidoniimonas polymericola TaxID=2528002 RepID=A0A5C5ZFC0_9BACT|nr:J domain-containing protein [Posidoniimonas polymericola]TWT85253.1 Chaperone protein DnaJ [Posidoniimonas polymericola]